MFTGIVEQTGRITFARASSRGRRIGVDAGPMTAGAAPGSSLCVSGVCLTVAAVTGPRVEFDVVRETLERSTLGAKKPGELVNLERALRVGDPVDGHFVQGHVDGTAEVAEVCSGSMEHRIRFTLNDQSLLPFLVPKGAIAVDGVSLTIAEDDRDGFSVALVPTTLERTTLARLSIGDAVNIETDVLVRAVVHNLHAVTGAGGLTVDALREAGLA